MKKKFLIIAILLISCSIFVGCKQKQIDYSLVERDIYNTGGNISFSYDSLSHSAIFGGEGEIIQFYSSDISKGWTEDGCRVGIKLLAPKEIDDYNSGSAILDGKKINAEDFFVEVEEGVINYAQFQPIVSKEKSHFQLKITWQEGFKEQTYNIFIKEGTLFMEE